MLMIGAFRKVGVFPSMKVPPKRKGNLSVESEGVSDPLALNESPSEKEGK